ncbi:MAG: T9SS type A sorting domain-containing protein [Bacteroidota bacterium]|nr:T9SS type A sorting domain-containing protein [Bacteroidota bacterium]
MKLINYILVFLRNIIHVRFTIYDLRFLNYSPLTTHVSRLISHLSPPLINPKSKIQNLSFNIHYLTFLLTFIIYHLSFTIVHAQAGNPAKQAPFAITNAGNSVTVNNQNYSWSVGEAIIFTGAYNTGFATQGFHQPMICKVIPTIVETNQTNCFAPYTLTVAKGFSKYQWFIGKSTIANGRSEVYLPIKNGKYSVFVGDSTGCFFTAASVNVDLNAKNIKPTVAVSGIVNSDTLLSSSKAATYQWYIIGTDGVHRAIVGATGQTYKPIYLGTYYVKINTSDNCVAYSDPYTLTNNAMDPLNRYTFESTDSTIIIEKQKPIEKISEHVLAVYPNPARGDFINVKYQSPENNTVTMNLYNVLGYVVSSQSVKNDKGKFEIKYNRNDLPVGKYILNLVDGDKKIVQSIVFE